MIISQCSINTNQEIIDNFSLKTEIILISILSSIFILMVLLLIFKDFIIKRFNLFAIDTHNIKQNTVNKMKKTVAIITIIMILNICLAIIMQSLSHIGLYYKKKTLFKIFDLIYKMFLIISSILLGIILMILMFILLEQLMPLEQEIIQGKKEEEKLIVEFQGLDKFVGPGIGNYDKKFIKNGVYKDPKGNKNPINAFQGTGVKIGETKEKTDIQEQ